jgi:hypothetical protein|tara:strand:+ start:380 stop:1255 length:876 start_codon:yes stop_codon:yes gene_type:complete
MILFKNKIIFIHPPKTGGTPIEYILYKHEYKKKLYNMNHPTLHSKILLGGFINKYYNKYNTTDGLQHLDKEMIKKIYPNSFNNFYKIGTIRNPFSRAVSMYNELVSHYSVLMDYYKINKNLDFKKFLFILLSDSCIHTHHKPLVYFFKKQDLNHLIKLENFKKDLHFILKKFKIKNHKVLNPYKKTAGLNYLNYYKDKENIDLVKKIFKEDLKEFNYDFEKFEKSEFKKSKFPCQMIMIDKKKNNFRKYVQRTINKFFFNIIFYFQKKQRLIFLILFSVLPRHFKIHRPHT